MANKATRLLAVYGILQSLHATAPWARDGTPFFASASDSTGQIEGPFAELMDLMRLSGFRQEVAEEAAAIADRGLDTAEDVLAEEDRNENNLMAMLNALITQILQTKAKASLEQAMAMKRGDLVAAEEEEKSKEASDAELKTLQDGAANLLKEMKEDAITETLQAVESAGEQEILNSADDAIDDALLKKVNANDALETAVSEGDAEAIAEAEEAVREAEQELEDAQGAAEAALETARESVTPQVALNFAEEELKEKQEEAQAAQEAMLNTFSEGGEGNLGAVLEAIDTSIEEQAAAEEVKEAAEAAGDYQAAAGAEGVEAEAKDGAEVAEEVAVESLIQQSDSGTGKNDEAASVPSSGEGERKRVRRRVLEDSEETTLAPKHSRVHAFLTKLLSYLKAPFSFLRRKLFRRSE
ncbi:hypothetical protein CSUI_000720 [Cystoisospora suis]|uniref:Uncharacterized protein n=1 Tax=Cystoisospora suis TaxID=483139 RepID=A0A2C6LCX1_9APIC|nr:hypothetical protein CSUI_000720 [Cystoisospora suis]